jgi:thioredoxin-dependent peroxiredoxin
MNEGDKAPDFELAASNGSTVRLSSFHGSKNVVLCFYPKNRLFMCPSKKVFTMAKSIIDSYSQITKTDSVLFAISVDTIEDQKRFVKEYTIPYLHLSDPTKETCKRYAGLNIAGLAKRATFVIDKNGIIRRIFRNIDVENHGKEIVSALSGLAV